MVSCVVLEVVARNFSIREVFLKIKNFAKFNEKHPCHNRFCNKVASWKPIGIPYT